MTVALSLLLMGLGVAVAARTLAEGVGGGLGLLVGAFLVVAGALRLYLGRR